MTPSLADVADEIIRRATARARFLVAIAGPPGAGKSTVAETLVDALGRRGETAVVLPMDGFHMDNAVLEEKGLLPRKGAPETFDVRGFIDIVRAIRAGGEVLVPVFDRSREIAIAAARVISPSHRIVVAEGNYLLLDEAPWSGLAGLFDLSVFLNVPEDVLAERLADRWRGYGLAPAEIAAKVGENDLPNGRRVLRQSRPADLVIANL
ncbi:nucleoside triphosphate hydrolase [Ciceribacter sp. RN22]|uniref:nucleoside triphosphate hydrolase n=1 Tax=Ciceribacter sp. RN22 TaxID=2954932 RepID=UPI00209340D4|nr:nucleoside triphosphate hydrolase [Ciceribacter sp. RN22]MCO6176682.1 nucleoside triphosphate hydrolase [Ciceribacter sp. RN22]